MQHAAALFLHRIRSSFRRAMWLLSEYERPYLLHPEG